MSTVQKAIYGRLKLNNIAGLKLWDSVHVYLIGTYIKSIRQHKPDGSIINNNVSLTCMTMIKLATGWFEIFEFPTYDLGEVTGGNDNYISKSSTIVIPLFNKTCLIIYPRPRKVVFDNRSEFKRYFTPLIKYFDIKHVLTTIKKPQYNAPLDRVHQVILNMFITKNIYNKVFDYIDPWVETLVSI